MEHQQARGRAVIEALEGLGRALHYETSREHVVGGSSAVDMAWTAASHSDVPLFVFEVESRPSSGMANNALKVLGPSTDRTLKPLFFFHLVLGGRPDNERMANLRAQWGSHNYRVYRFSDTTEARRLLSDVLLQHRRVSNGIIARALIRALQPPVWGPHDVDDVLREIEQLRFVSNYLRDYALLAQEDDRLLPAYVRRVQALYAIDGQEASMVVDSYGGNGDYIPGLLERAILVGSGAIDDTAGPAVLERWQTSSYMRMIGAYFGLSRDYDDFILRVAPLHYVAAAAALRGRAPATYSWLVGDLEQLLIDMIAAGVKPPWYATAALWLAHLSAAGLNGQPGGDRALYERAYRRAGDALPQGAAGRFLTSPPMPSWDDDQEPPVQGTGPPLPTPERLRSLSIQQPAEPTWPSGPALALRMLTDDEWPLLPAACLLSALHRGP